MANKDVTEQFLGQESQISFTDNNVTRYLSSSTGFKELGDGRTWAVWSPKHDTSVTIVKVGEAYYLKQGSCYLSWSDGSGPPSGGRMWAVWSPKQDVPIRITHDDQTGLYFLTNAESRFPLLSWSDGNKDLKDDRRWSVWSTTSDTPISIVRSFPVHVDITAPFGVGDLVAEVALEGGETTNVVLRGGKFEGHFLARATRLTLSTTQLVPDGTAPLALGNVDQSCTPNGTLVNITQLFDHGIDIPADGRLAVQLKWGAASHGKSSESGSSQRFGSFEHVRTADFVGKDKNGQPLTCDDPLVVFDKTTPLPLGNKAFNFGEIIALAGDFYAHLDKKAASEFASAWPTMGWIEGWIAGPYKVPTLVDDKLENTKDIVDIVNNDLIHNGFQALLEVAWTSLGLARRFVALASVNHCHFGMQSWEGIVHDPSNEARTLYCNYHGRAVAQATAARKLSPEKRADAFLQALAVEAFGCHFLTDLFASGHIRVPRRLLGDRFGIPRGALIMSAGMHEEDNDLGLWCQSRETVGSEHRVVWRAYGDYQLSSPNSKLHCAQVREAVRRSAAEIFYAFCGKPAPDKAEDLLPVPLRAGTGPVKGDMLPNGQPAPLGERNHYPRYAQESGGGDPSESAEVGLKRSCTTSWSAVAAPSFSPARHDGQLIVGVSPSPSDTCCADYRDRSCHAGSAPALGQGRRGDAGGRAGRHVAVHVPKLGQRCAATQRLAPRSDP